MCYVSGKIINISRIGFSSVRLWLRLRHMADKWLYHLFCCVQVQHILRNLCFFYDPVQLTVGERGCIRYIIPLRFRGIKYRMIWWRIWKLQPNLTSNSNHYVFASIAPSLCSIGIGSRSLHSAIAWIIALFVDLCWQLFRWILIMVELNYGNAQFVIWLRILI